MSPTPCLICQDRRRRSPRPWSFIPTANRLKAFIKAAAKVRSEISVSEKCAFKGSWLVDALQQQFGERLLINPQAGGMHLIAGLREGDDVELAQRALAIGIAVEPLSQWYLEAKPRHGLVLGFTNIASAEQASAVALRLAQIIRGCETFKSSRE